MHTTRTGCFNGHHPHFFDYRVAEFISKIVGPDYSILDLGCGDGDYVYFWRLMGISCRGVDGNPMTDGHNITFSDLTGVMTHVISADFVSCLEVMEHIPPELESSAVYNLGSLARSGIFLSWARPGQGGTGHVNERDPEYVERIMKERGFTIDEAITRGLRNVARLPWFKTNLLYLRRERPK